jgi:uncharacterized protein YndB with AHSA1/START domain
MHKITIETKVAVPIADAWRAFNDPDDILQWDASDDWRTTWVSNDLEVGGKLLLRIEANGGGMASDFVAIYTQIEANRLIEFRADDDCMVRLEFVETDAGVTIRQTFDAESTRSEDQQRSEWQGVLDRFAGYVERQCGANR